MSNGYDHHSIHHHRRHDRKTIFLPMFCRLSFKDVINPHSRLKNPISGDGEPSSPKVSCMGQVKRNNRVIAFPTSAAPRHYSYSRLKKLFSAKTLLPTPTSSIPAAISAGPVRIGSCRGSRACARGLRRSKSKDDGDCAKAVNVCELDPPLPVVRKAAAAGYCGCKANLWRRRFKGAAALKALEIEQIRNFPKIPISQPPPIRIE